MAYQSSIELFLGTDRQLRVHVKTADGLASVDITGWALSFKVKSHATESDARAVLAKDTGSGGITISGSFNSNPILNSMRAIVAIADDDTDPIPLDRGVWELKRTDAGYETVLAYGPVTFIRAVHGS